MKKEKHYIQFNNLNVPGMSKFFTRLFAMVMLALAVPFASAYAQDAEEETDLQALLDSFEYGIDDYVYSNAPGCIGDEAAYTEFFNVYSDALQMASSTTATDAEKAEMCKKLIAAKAAAEAAINPLTDGTYYIVTAYSAFNEADSMAWFAPYDGNYPGWKAKQSNVLFMWNIKKLESGNWSIQSVSTGQYVNHNDVIDGQETNMYMTDALETEQVFDNINPGGQFNIHCVGAKWTYNIQHHNSGAATSGPIGNWQTKTASSEGSWRLVPVSAEEIAAAEATKSIDILSADVAAFNASGYTFGSDPGQYSQEAYDAYVAEYNVAKALLESETPSEEACAAELEKYQAAKKALTSSRVEVTTGYYSISTIPYSNASGSNGVALSIQESNPGFLYAITWDTSNPKFIWKVTQLDNGRYSIQNYKSGQYINATDLLSQGASISMTDNHTTDQVITRRSGELYNVNNTMTKSNNFGYAIVTDYVYIVSGNGTSVYFHKYSEEEAANIATSYEQKLRTDSLNNLLATIAAKTDVDSTYTIDLNSPIVTSASQLFITNQSTEGQELNNLIDGNPDTHCISAYNNSYVSGTSKNDYHAIRIDAGEGKTLPLHLGLHWRARNSVWAAMYRPVDVIFYASNDANTWVELGELSNPGAGFPTAAEDPEYTSSTPITFPKAYRYLNMKVIKTNTMDLGLYGYPFFTFSEFNAYPMTGEPNAAVQDPEIKAALATVRAAVSVAEAKVNANNVTSKDIADLQAAYNEFLLVWKDTADLYKIYETSMNFQPSVVAGEEMFCYPGEMVDAFEEALAEVDDNRPFTEINQREVARLDTLLTNAYYALRRSMIGPAADKWYYILCKDQQNSSQYVNKKAYMGGYSASDGLGCGGLESSTTDMRTVWSFVATDEPGVYNMLGAGSGWPINRGPVLLESLGDGQFSIKTTSNLDAPYFIMPSILPGVPSSNSIKAVKDGLGAWSMTEIEEGEHTETLSLKSYKAYALVRPYDTYDLPSSLTEGHTVTAYSICGYQLSEDGKYITGINLTEFTPDEDSEITGIPAGTPYIIIVDPDAEYESDATVKIDLKAQVGSILTQDLTVANGLAGTYSPLTLAAGKLKIAKKEAQVTDEGASLSIRLAYIDPLMIKNDPEASIDYVLPVNGTLEAPTGIRTTEISKSFTSGNVYTLDGVLVKKNVKAANAKDGLAKGIYVIGKKKVLVK